MKTQREPTIIQICERLEHEGNTQLEDRELIEKLRSKVSKLVSIEHSVHRHIMHVRGKLIERYPKGTLMHMILKDNLPTIREKIDEVSPENDIEKALHDFRTQKEAREFCRTYVENLKTSHRRVLQADPFVSAEMAAQRILLKNIRHSARRLKISPEIYQNIWVHVLKELFPDAIQSLKNENTKNNYKPYNLYVLTSSERKKARKKLLEDRQKN